jgi:phosphoglycolate phosphatase
MRLAPRCVVHRGVEAALDAAEARGCAIGLGTGNVREGARLKLERVGLHHRFAFGGFGCDHELRAELIRVGAERGARALGAPLEACRVVVIGDTPKDIAAAQAIGAECLAVATGTFTTADLTAHAPTRVVADLAEAGALAALLGDEP